MQLWCDDVGSVDLIHKQWKDLYNECLRVVKAKGSNLWGEKA